MRLAFVRYRELICGQILDWLAGLVGDFHINANQVRRTAQHRGRLVRGLLRRSLLGARWAGCRRRDDHGRGLGAGLLLLRRSLARLSRSRPGDQRGQQPQRRDFVSHLSHQKLNRAITSIVRMDPALVTRPNEDDPSVAETPENAGVFVRFWTSQRMSK